MMTRKKKKLIRFLEKRQIVLSTELLELLGSRNTLKSYLKELSEYGVIQARDIVWLDNRQVALYCISHENLELYKQDLERRRQKRLQNLWRGRPHY